MSNTTFVTVTGFLEYARIFPENIDMWEAHASRGGQYNVNFYPESEEDLAKLLDSGMPKTYPNGKDAFQSGADLGVGKFVKLKRYHDSDYEGLGGAPKVFDFREGPSSKEWSFSEDGALGNGTKANARIEVYKTRKGVGARLKSVAILEHVPFESAPKEDWEYMV